MAKRNSLAEQFRSPPAVARPRVWWHWMNGNVTERGIRLDLEWMKRVGIGGVHNFEAAFEMGGDFDTPQVVERPVRRSSPEWCRAVKLSGALASELGLEFAVGAAAGWSQTGGPWVRPEHAMKKLVWAETQVRGGVPFNGRLLEPPKTTGTFQNIPLVLLSKTKSTLSYYAHIATLAYRVPEPVEHAPTPIVESSAGAIDSSLLSDGDLATCVQLPYGDTERAWIQFSYPQPTLIQAITLVVARPPGLFDPLRESGPVCWLEASVEGHGFRKIVDLPSTGALQQTVSFDPVTASVYRVVLEKPRPSRAEQRGVIPMRMVHEIAELLLHAEPRVNRFEDKAGFSTRQIVEADDTPAIPEHKVIDSADVINLTGRISSDGSLQWVPPVGQWIVLRLGCSLTGRVNHPACEDSTGLEVDKLNAVAVQVYLENYLREYQRSLGPGLFGAKGLQSVVTDSYEAGAQNWTDDLLAQFKLRRGYDALLWMPVLTGRVIQSAQASDRFLWDFRKTLAELIAEAHYAQITKTLHQKGLKHYAESHENGRAFIGDGMEAKKTVDVPTAAIWSARPPGMTAEVSDADIRESASVAHVYGKSLVAGESFTALGSTYAVGPADLKRFADRAMTMGLNRFAIHASVHQPDDRLGPCIGLGPFGQWITRKETWAELAGSFFEYLSRSCHLLQQGRFVADIAYVYGEDTNITSLFQKSAPAIPPGFNFDFINPDALIHELIVQAGNLVTRSGMIYRLIMLDTSTRRMSLPMLRKLHALAAMGAVLVGQRPLQTPSLADQQSEFDQLAADLSPYRNIDDALAALDLSADVMLPTNSELRFVHRTLEEGELYFIVSNSAQQQTADISFRITDRRPELWRAETAEISPLSYRIDERRTHVTLSLEAYDAVFVLFREPAAVSSLTVSKKHSQVVTTLEGTWEISFAGGPDTHFKELRSWTEHMDPDVKFFSGTAIYRKTILVSTGITSAASTEWLLDLGHVCELAEVFVNGRRLGVLWKTPFRLDVTDALKTGANELEIRITNLWPNRLIGDKQLGSNKVAFAAFDPFRADSVLLPSGLLGPVTLHAISLVDREEGQGG